MSILGPLISARLNHGDRQTLLQAAATRVYETPDGRRVRNEWRTLESWYYQYKAEGLKALQPRQRKDAGVCRAIATETAKLASRVAWARFSLTTLENASLSHARSTGGLPRDRVRLAQSSPRLVDPLFRHPGARLVSSDRRGCRRRRRFS